jgi:DNA-binding NtrC family response regulator
MSSTMILGTTDPYQWPQTIPATILLVEDEPTVREVTRQALEMGGYRMLEASSPEEAAHIASNSCTEIDLLLTDVVMPGMSGPELARRMSEVRFGLVTLFMTGYTECEVARAVHGTLQHHIQKPFTVNVLLSRVARALATRWEPGSGIRPAQFPSP